MKLNQSRKVEAAQRCALLAEAELTECLYAFVGNKNLGTVRVKYPNTSTKIPEELILFAMDHDAHIELLSFDRISVYYDLVPNKKGGLR